MRVAVTANQVPFVRGGSEHHIRGLVEQLMRRGHEVETIRFPFRFQPEAAVTRLMDFCETVDFDGLGIDRVISLQFPGYGVRHEDHRIWVMHQHREVYELYDPDLASDDLAELRGAVRTFDERVLPRARHLFANSKRVAARLMEYNSLVATPLYHPPPSAERYYEGDSWDYVFFPSRLERLKRQDLLIEAAALLQTPVRILMGGTGGQRDYYQSLIERHELGDRVRLIGEFAEDEKYALYANALAIFFGPRDEDYGYVTLEAMLSAKPVITCTDSGGPCEFVRDGENGFVVEPEPAAVAEAIDSLYSSRRRAKDMGAAGRADYSRMGIGWEHVIDTLMTD